MVVEASEPSGMGWGCLGSIGAVVPATADAVEEAEEDRVMEELVGTSDSE
jgi:hypothetical protein